MGAGSGVDVSAGGAASSLVAGAGSGGDVLAGGMVRWAARSRSWALGKFDWPPICCSWRERKGGRGRQSRLWAKQLHQFTHLGDRRHRGLRRHSRRRDFQWRREDFWRRECGWRFVGSCAGAWSGRAARERATWGRGNLRWRRFVVGLVERQEKDPRLEATTTCNRKKNNSQLQR